MSPGLLAVTLRSLKSSQPKLVGFVGQKNNMQPLFKFLNTLWADFLLRLGQVKNFTIRVIERATLTMRTADRFLFSYLMS